MMCVGSAMEPYIKDKQPTKKGWVLVVDQLSIRSLRNLVWDIGSIPCMATTKIRAPLDEGD